MARDELDTGQAAGEGAQRSGLGAQVQLAADAVTGVPHHLSHRNVAQPGQLLDDPGQRDEFPQVGPHRGHGARAYEHGAAAGRAELVAADGTLTTPTGARITGYFAIQASGYDEAVAMATGCPAFEHGESVVVYELT